MALLLVKWQIMREFLVSMVHRGVESLDLLCIEGLTAPML